MPFCSQCGASAPDHAKFCPSCGAAIQSAAGPDSAPPPVARTQAPGGMPPPTAPYDRPPPPAPALSNPALSERVATPLATPLAGLGKRFAAHLIDSLIVFIIFWAIGTQVAESVGATTAEGFSLDGTPALVTMALSFAASVLYFTLMEGRDGQSLGKKALGIKVVNADGTKCSMRQAFIRNLLRIIDGFALYLVGIILILQSKSNQRLGDRIAETLVIIKEKVPSKGSYVYRSSDRDKPEEEKEDNGKLKVRSSWGIKKGRDSWDM